MAKKQESRTRRIVGVIVVLVAIVCFVALFGVQSAEGWFTSHVVVQADFRTTAGLRAGSPVQLGGVAIGKVTSIDFVEATYECVPLTEDVGRQGEGRTDDCDASLFCAPVGLCADLEPHTDDTRYVGCLDSFECAADEVCYTSEFRRRSARVVWAGPQNVCVRFSTAHHRVRVQLDVIAEALQLIRRDSLAMVTSNTLLGDLLVGISPGVGEPLGDDRRVLVRPSLSEDIEQWRARLDRAMIRIDSSMTSIAEVFDALNDPRVIAALKGTFEHLESITHDIADQRGLVGALIGSEQYHEDIGVTLREIRAGTEGAEEIMVIVNRILKTGDRNIVPVFDDLQATSRTLRTLLQDLQDPANKSLAGAILYDEDRKMAENLEKILDDLEETSDALAAVARRIEKGKGTLGKLVNHTKLRDDVVRLLGNVERSDLLKAILLYVLERKGLGIKASRSSAGPN